MEPSFVSFVVNFILRSLPIKYPYLPLSISSFVRGSTDYDIKFLIIYPLLLMSSMTGVAFFFAELGSS